MENCLSLPLPFPSSQCLSSALQGHSNITPLCFHTSSSKFLTLLPSLQCAPVLGVFHVLALLKGSCLQLAPKQVAGKCPSPPWFTPTLSVILFFYLWGWQPELLLCLISGHGGHDVFFPEFTVYLQATLVLDFWCPFRQRGQGSGHIAILHLGKAKPREISRLGQSPLVSWC